MKSNPVIIERVYPVPVSEIWDAITNNEKLKQWYFKLPEFKPEVGFEFSFYGGKTPERTYRHIGVVTAVVPYKRLSYSWRYEGLSGDSEVSFELFDEEDKTRVQIIHTGIETLAPGDPDFAPENFIEGWTYFLNTALKDFLSVQTL